LTKFNFGEPCILYREWGKSGNRRVKGQKLIAKR
jgi:hypothetical protein